MSRTAKGNEAERRAQLYLEGRGYAVERAKPERVRLPDGRTFNRSYDFWNVFDLIAVAPGEPVMFVQITASKSTSDVTKRKSKVAESAYLFPGSGIASLEVWQWVGGRKSKSQRAQYFRQWAWIENAWTEITPEGDGR